MKSIRTNVDTTFVSWYDEILILADTIGATDGVPRKTRLQRNGNNTPSTTPQEHYKRAVSIPLLDSLVTQLNERFTGENSHQAACTFVPHTFTDSFLGVKCTALRRIRQLNALEC